jgi:hypothetical protein
MNGLLEVAFSAWSVPRSYLEDSWGDQIDKSSAWEAVKIEPQCIKLKNPPLLEATAREWLVKTQQVGKGLACAVVICGD